METVKAANFQKQNIILKTAVGCEKDANSAVERKIILSKRIFLFNTYIYTWQAVEINQIQGKIKRKKGPFIRGLFIAAWQFFLLNTPLSARTKQTNKLLTGG